MEWHFRHLRSRNRLAARHDESCHRHAFRRDDCYCMEMLRNFLYLNTLSLDGYLSALEDGLRVGSESEQNSTVDGSIEADARFIKANVGRSTGGTRRTTGQDTSEARFNRLMEIAERQTEELGWIDVHLRRMWRR
jgi:hypothetical protein